MMGNGTFGWAIDRMRDGSRVQRNGWDNHDKCLGLQEPDAASKITSPYIYCCTGGEKFVPWIASQQDILATDWVLFRDPTEEVTSIAPPRQTEAA